MLLLPAARIRLAIPVSPMVLLCDNVANGGPLAIGPLAGGEQMVVGLLRLRFAAGVCVLAAGLLMGGGAVAVADPGSSDSAANSTDNASSASTGKKNPKDEPGTDTNGEDGTNDGTGHQPRNRRQDGATTSRTNGGTDTNDETKTRRRHIDTGAAPSTTGARYSRQPAPATVATGARCGREPAPLQSAPAPRFDSRRRLPLRRAGSRCSRAGAAAVATGAAAVAPAPPRSRRLPAAVAPAPLRSRRLPLGRAGPARSRRSRRHRVGSGHARLGCRCGRPGHATAVRPLFLLVGIAGSAPVSDVIALIQDMLTSVAGAVVPVTQLQSELAFFLFGITGVEPVVDAGGRIDSAALSAAVHAWVASELPRRSGVCRYPGYAGGRHRNRGCTARGDCGVHFRRDDPGR